ncbi:hypothetical protein EVAR_87796_1 [Eumeta japonica]|uniref:Uncharacterized protein n=1 Tax=Eumeta variegata TaxID=151549 RepID=A0A4C1X3B3_EUMVA|nr:hypothetical protein EVAR_87796_1 [Eumeta japonica]
MYGSGSWVWQKKNESRINAVATGFLCEVSRKDRCRNSDVRERHGLKEDLKTSVERGFCSQQGTFTAYVGNNQTAGCIQPVV